MQKIHEERLLILLFIHTYVLDFIVYLYLFIDFMAYLLFMVLWP